MKRLLLVSFMVAIAVSAMALIGLRSSSGPDVASAHVNQGTVHVELDLVKDGTGPDVWCNPVDTAATHFTDGSSYEVAICLSDAAANMAPASFNIQVTYDDTLNSCTDVANTSTGLDDNPDANAGSSVFSGSTGAGNLGTGWDCSGAPGSNYPVCDKDLVNSGPGFGVAFISCLSVIAPALPVGVGTSHPIAVLTLSATAAGTDNLAFGVTAIYRSGGANVLRCPPTGSMAECGGGVDTKEAAPTATPLPPTSTPTATSTPTSTPTVTPTPQYPYYCDIGVLAPLTASATTVSMKVGDPPAIVTIGNSWKNYGATLPAIASTCNFARVMGAELFVSGLPLSYSSVSAAIPAGLGVRMDPEGLPPQAGFGDVCISCYPTQVGKSIGDCLDPLKGGTGPFDTPPNPNQSTWTYMPVGCDETAMPYPPFSVLDESCEDGIDQQAANPNPTPPATPDPHKGTCDWGGFSKLCTTPTTPDSYCKDIQAVGLHPYDRKILAPDATVAQQREIKIECRAPGIYPLLVFSAVSQATDIYPGGAGMGATDPNVANDRSMLIINVLCEPEMLKDCDTDAEGIQTSCVLWLMSPTFPGGVEFGTSPPVTLPAADANGCVLPIQGKGCLAVDVWVKNAQDWDNTNDSDLIPECLGAWEHQVRYDHKILRFLNNLNPKTIDTNQDTIADVSWLESLGRIANCTYSVLGEDWILEGCVTKDSTAPGMQVGPCGDGIIEKMVIIPQTQDLIYRGVFRPTKNNGVVTNIVDDNCEITDIYGEPMADTLPGQLVPICGNLSITVRMLEGDTDLDCDVDVVDDQALAFRYGTSFGLQLYDQWYDLEGPNLSLPDGDIDIKDLQFVFGRNYSTCQTPRPDDQSIPVDPGQP